MEASSLTFMKSTLSGNIMFKRMAPGIGIAVYMLLLSCLSGKAQQQEVEALVQQQLSLSAECYALVLQTGRVTLPLGGRYPHVLYPQRGGTETPIPNVWIVNAGYDGEIYECRGCDSCMTAYRNAGLIDYHIECRDTASVTARVSLTEKGRQYLIENQVQGFYPVINAWRRREQLEVVMVAREQYQHIEVTPTHTPYVFLCKVPRRLTVTPFLQAIGGNGENKTKQEIRKFKVDLTQQPPFHAEELY